MFYMYFILNEHISTLLHNSTTPHWRPHPSPPRILYEVTFVPQIDYIYISKYSKYLKPPTLPPLSILGKISSSGGRGCRTSEGSSKTLKGLYNSTFCIKCTQQNELGYLTKAAVTSCPYGNQVEDLLWMPNHGTISFIYHQGYLNTTVTKEKGTPLLHPLKGGDSQRPWHVHAQFSEGPPVLMPIQLIHQNNIVSNIQQASNYLPSGGAGRAQARPCSPHVIPGIVVEDKYI
jgi:hypothetical protein